MILHSKNSSTCILHGTFVICLVTQPINSGATFGGVRTKCPGEKIPPKIATVAFETRCIAEDMADTICPPPFACVNEQISESCRTPEVKIIHTHSAMSTNKRARSFGIHVFIPLNNSNQRWQVDRWTIG